MKEASTSSATFASGCGSNWWKRGRFGAFSTRCGRRRTSPFAWRLRGQTRRRRGGEVNPTPRLAVTLGDPRGIGPEIVAKMLRDGRATREASLVLVGPTGSEIDVDETVGHWHAGGDPVLAGKLAGAAIERAIALARAGTVDGVVTAPIDKSVLLTAGYDYPGHTEML